MKTVKYSYTNEYDREITLTAICVSKMGLENLEVLSADAEGSLEYSVIPADCTDDLPDGWAIVEAERAYGHEWRSYYECEALIDALKACEPALAEADLSDLVTGEETMAQVYVCVDESMEAAPELSSLDHAYDEVVRVGKEQGYEGLAELAVAAHKAFAGTAVAQALRLAIKYDAEAERVYVSGKPERARGGEDVDFAQGIIRDMGLEARANEYGFEVAYDVLRDAIELAQEAEEEE